MINKDIKDIKFTDLLKLQKQIDEELNKTKEDGFIPRKRILLDRILSIDNCFQNWLQELPTEYNFITYFPKESNRTKELIKLTNILFFFLEYFNSTDGEWTIEFFELDKWFDNFREGIEIKYLRKEIINFKMELWSSDYIRAFFNWIHICKLRNFTKEEIIQTYINKYKLIMENYKREEVEKNGND